jgi:hypothetical protein
MPAAPTRRDQSLLDAARFGPWPLPADDADTSQLGRAFEAVRRVAADFAARAAEHRSDGRLTAHGAALAAASDAQKALDELGKLVRPHVTAARRRIADTEAKLLPLAHPDPALAVEVRNVLRALTPAERLDALHHALDSGDTSVGAAVLTASPLVLRALTRDVPGFNLDEYRAAWLARSNPEAAATLDRLTAGVTVLDGALGHVERELQAAIEAGARAKGDGTARPPEAGLRILAGGPAAAGAAE